MEFEGLEIYAAKMCEIYENDETIRSDVVDCIMDMLPTLSSSHMSPFVKQLYGYTTTFENDDVVKEFINDLFNCQLYWTFMEVKHLYENKGSNYELLLTHENDITVRELVDSPDISREALILFAKYLLETREPFEFDPDDEVHGIYCDFESDRFVVLNKFEWQDVKTIRSFIHTALTYFERDKKYMCRLNVLDAHMLNSLSYLLEKLTYPPEIAVEPKYYIEQLIRISDKFSRQKFHEEFCLFNDVEKTNIFMNILRSGYKCSGLFELSDLKIL